ncbi:hypothetical protein DES53_115168 [Roseimicrobium gellanilyticum]|uniref:Uncharacterized protein n=1 Tax=Roseimicrobium gellanilyticum TaxID=748857 RepID=A0A366H6K2_9BACT|nr:hypothetical protein DES53_115168 [Roseimicrobium gellanilyticum]
MPYADPVKRREDKARRMRERYQKDAKHRADKRAKVLAHYHETKTDEVLEAKRRRARATRPEPASNVSVAVTRQIRGSSEEWRTWSDAQEASGLNWTEWLRRALNAYAARRTPKTKSSA